MEPLNAMQSFMQLLEETDEPGSMVENYDILIHPDTAIDIGYEGVSLRVVYSRLFPIGKILAVPRLRNSADPLAH